MSVRWTRPLVSGALAAALAAGAVAACSSSGSGGSGSGSGSGALSGNLKIITWENPPAVQAITAIDKAFMKKYPSVHVSDRKSVV